MKELPDSRVYVHRKCNAATIVSGDDFRRLSRPFHGSPGTFCVHCTTFFPIGEFVWADTEETIPEAHARLRKLAPAWATVILGRVGCLVMLLMFLAGGLLGGWQLAKATDWPRWLVMPLVGFAAMIVSVLIHQAIENFVRGRYFGADDWREVK